MFFTAGGVSLPTRYFRVLCFLCFMTLLPAVAQAQWAVNSQSNAASASGSVVINFDGRFNGETIYEQYLNCCKVRFLTNGPYPVSIDYGNYGNRPPSIATDPGDQQEVILEFATPVKDFEFWILAIDNTFGVVGYVDVTFNDGSTSPNHPINNNGGHVNSPSHGDGLRALTNIKRIRIHSIIDAAGLAFDDFSQAGWNHWTANITHCAFDMNCIDTWRVNTSRAFFFAPEFIGNNPVLAESNRGTPAYNREFVRWCYKGYLAREPDQAGWNFWTNELNKDNNYDHIIRAFIVSPEYRGRFGPPFPNPWP